MDGENWIQIQRNGSRDYVIDLNQLEAAARLDDGGIRLWMKSGRQIDIEGEYSSSMDDFWLKIKNHSNRRYAR